VGVAAVQLCVAAGASVIAVAGTDAKLEMVRDLGASVTVNYKTTPEFSVPVLAATSGRGVDVILDCVGV
jgi:NADPH:quinone reductase-like Zn-dependent oxidoreductase